MRRIRLVIPIILLLAVAGLATTLAKKHSVTIQDMKFSPSSIEIAVGDSVEWTNDDDRDHTVTGSGFDSGNLGNGRSFSHTFSKAGKYPYRCSLHPRMKGTVVVTGN
jgi:plastocyanin